MSERYRGWTRYLTQDWQPFTTGTENEVWAALNTVPDEDGAGRPVSKVALPFEETPWVKAPSEDEPRTPYVDTDADDDLEVA